MITEEIKVWHVEQDLLRR